MKRLILAVSALAVVAAGVNQVRAADEDPAITIFKKNGCNECHSISAVGVQKAPKKAPEGAAAPATGAAPATTTPPATASTETKKKKTPPDLSGVGLEHDAKWISAFINKEE